MVNIQLYKKTSNSIKFESDYYEMTISFKLLKTISDTLGVVDESVSLNFNYVYNIVHTKAKPIKANVEGFSSTDIDEITPIERRKLTLALIKYIEKEVFSWGVINDGELELVGEYQISSDTNEEQ